MIAAWDRHVDNRIHTMLEHIKVKHLGVENDNIPDILETADEVYIAYDDPRHPRTRQIATKQVCSSSPRPQLTPQSTQQQAHKVLHGLNDDDTIEGRLHATMHTPHILHMLHTMTRPELENHAALGTGCRKRRRAAAVTPDPRKEDKPTKRRLITSRWNMAQEIQYYEKMKPSAVTQCIPNNTYAHDTPIT